MLIRDGDQLRVHLDGDEKPLLTAKAGQMTKDLIFGKGLQGKLDEITVWDRAIEPKLISELWAISKIAEENAARAERRAKRKVEKVAVASGVNWSASIRFTNTKASNVSPVTAYLISRGPKGDHQAPGDHLGIGGNLQGLDARQAVRFQRQCRRTNRARQDHDRAWNLERGKDRWSATGARVKVLAQWSQVEIDAELPVTAPGAKELFFGQTLR